MFESEFHFHISKTALESRTTLIITLGVGHCYTNYYYIIIVLDYTIYKLGIVVKSFRTLLIINS